MIDSVMRTASIFWQRLLATLKAFDEAIHFDYDEIQDRRIAALRQEVIELKAHVDRK